MKIYERIRSYVLDHGLKIRSVAQKANVEEKRFYRILSGASEMTADEYERVVRHGLGIDPSYFFASSFLENKNELSSA